MLMITRKPGEKILIGQDVTIEIVEIAGNTVRVGISAPRELPVYREELWESVKRENEAAAGADPKRLGELADEEDQT